MDADIKITYATLSKRLNLAIERRNALHADLQAANVEVDALSNIIKGLTNLFGDELKVKPIPENVSINEDYTKMSFIDKVVGFLTKKKRVTVPQIEAFLLTQGEVKVLGKYTLRKRVTDALYRLRKDERVVNDGKIDDYTAYRFLK